MYKQAVLDTKDKDPNDCRFLYCDMEETFASSLRKDNAGCEWLAPKQTFWANVWNREQVPWDPFSNSGVIRYLVDVRKILTPTTTLYFVNRDTGHSRTFVTLLAIDHASNAMTQFPGTEALRLQRTGQAKSGDVDVRALPNPFLFCDSNDWQVSSEVFVRVIYAHEVRVDDKALDEFGECIYRWEDKDSGSVIRPRKRAGAKVKVCSDGIEYD